MTEPPQQPPPLPPQLPPAFPPQLPPAFPPQLPTSVPNAMPTLVPTTVPTLVPTPAPRFDTAARQGGISALAVAGVALSLLVPVVAIPLSLVGLRRSGRGDPGRGLAISGLVLGVLGLGIYAAAGVIGFRLATDVAGRGPDGAVTKAGRAPAADLRLRDCLKDAVGDGQLTSLTVVPCAQPHQAQVLHTYEMSARPYPAVDNIGRDANTRCGTAAETNLPTDVPADATMTYIYPTAFEWNKGNRKIVCLVNTTKPSTTSLVLASAV